MPAKRAEHTALIADIEGGENKSMLGILHLSHLPDESNHDDGLGVDIIT